MSVDNGFRSTVSAPLSGRDSRVSSNYENNITDRLYGPVPYISTHGF